MTTGRYIAIYIKLAIGRLSQFGTDKAHNMVPLPYPKTGILIVRCCTAAICNYKGMKPQHMPIKNIIKCIIGAIDTATPKRNNRYCFFISRGTPWDANMQCIFAYISHNKAIECKVIYSCDRGKQSAPANYRMPASSLASWLYLFTSKTVIFDHACPPGLSKNNRCMVNLWHGVPIKAIRFFDKNSFTKGYLQEQSRNTSLLIASSDIDRLAMSASFQIDPEHVKVTGLPRNDILINPDKFDVLLPAISQQKKFLRHAIGDKRLILYAPTYRGSSSEKTSDFKPSIMFEKKLAKVLEEHHAIFAVRPHKFSGSIQFEFLATTQNYLELPEEKISNSNVLLAQTSILITDYSSIWVDFLLTDNAIIGYVPDLDKYLSHRGYIYDLEETFPGAITKTEEDLLKQIEKELVSPLRPSEKQLSIKKQFHKFNDGMNTERTIKELERLNQC